MADEHALILSSDREEIMKKIEMIQLERSFEDRKSFRDTTQAAYEKCFKNIAEKDYKIGGFEFKRFSENERRTFSQMIEERVPQEIKKVVACWTLHIALYPALLFLFGDTTIGAILFTLNVILGTAGSTLYSIDKKEFFTFLFTKKRLAKMDQQKALEVAKA